jgi:nicotinamide riboside kinase
MVQTDPLLICLIGAECTGKTTLAQSLAQEFSGRWVPERLRQFCDALGRTPLQHEQTDILEQQARDELAALEEATRQQQSTVFCDTAPLLTAVYSEFVFGDTSLYPRARALHARYALTLVLEPDLPWIADGLQRDGASVQLPIHTKIMHELQHMGSKIVLVAGTGPLRAAAARAAMQTGLMDDFALRVRHPNLLFI